MPSDLRTPPKCHSISDRPRQGECDSRHRTQSRFLPKWLRSRYQDQQLLLLLFLRAAAIIHGQLHASPPHFLSRSANTWPDILPQRTGHLQRVGDSWTGSAGEWEQGIRRIEELAAGSGYCSANCWRHLSVRTDMFLLLQIHQKPKGPHGCRRTYVDLYEKS